MDEIESVLESQASHIRKLNELVAEALDEEILIVNNLKNPPSETLSKGQKLSDKVARFGGSWKFIIVFGVVLSVWILYNVAVSKNDQFDPYPFILMNLILSCVAAMQAPIIMMSQNRKEEKDRKRAENDYMINLKAEIEIRNLHRKVHILMEEQMHQLITTQVEELRLLKDLQGKLDKLTEAAK